MRSRLPPILASNSHWRAVPESTASHTFTGRVCLIHILQLIVTCCYWKRASTYRLFFVRRVCHRAHCRFCSTHMQVQHCRREYPHTSRAFTERSAFNRGIFKIAVNDSRDWRPEARGVSKKRRDEWLRLWPGKRAATLFARPHNIFSRLLLFAGCHLNSINLCCHAAFCEPKAFFNSCCRWWSVGLRSWILCRSCRTKAGSFHLCAWALLPTRPHIKWQTNGRKLKWTNIFLPFERETRPRITEQHRPLQKP